MTVSKNGVMYINPNKISYKILKWMQEHEGTQTLKKTTNHNIADKICALPDVTNGITSIEQAMSKMVRNKVIYRDKYPHGICADFRINYWHKSIPADILANAPVEVKRAMTKTIDDMTPGQYMDNEGCVVTPAYVEKSEDPFNEDMPLKEICECRRDTVTVEDTAPQSEEPVEIKPVEKTVEEAVAQIKEEKIKEAEARKEVLKEPVETPVEATPIRITKSKDGKTTYVTINLTINL